MLKSWVCGVWKYFTAGYSCGPLSHLDGSPEWHLHPLFSLWADKMSTQARLGHSFAMIRWGPSNPWALWPLGWAASLLSPAVICLRAQALITPAISLPSRTADVINGHEIIQCLSKRQSQSMFVPVTSHSTPFPFFILLLYWPLTWAQIKD